MSLRDPGGVVMAATNDSYQIAARMFLVQTSNVSA